MIADVLKRAQLEGVELYLDNGDGLAGHEYWDRGDVYLVEQLWPAWLQARLAAIEKLKRGAKSSRRAG